MSHSSSDVGASRRSNSRAPMWAAPSSSPTTARPHRPTTSRRRSRRPRARRNEGLMVKDPTSIYSPGRRGYGWMKMKKALATIDCVVVGVEVGHGKRHGVLSDYTFAVRDEANDRLVTIGKAYSGLTDAEIAEMTDWFLAHTISVHGRYRVVEPTIVVEIAFDVILRSKRHKSGFALRFPRIAHLRRDKPAAEADTLVTVERLFSELQHGSEMLVTAGAKANPRFRSGATRLDTPKPTRAGPRDAGHRSRSRRQVGGTDGRPSSPRGGRLGHGCDAPPESRHRTDRRDRARRGPGARRYPDPSKSQLSRRLMEHGVTERDFTDMARVMTRPGDVILDVGASIGYFTILFATWAGPQGRVLAHEPWPSARAYLLHNVERNRPRQHLVRLARAGRRRRHRAHVAPDLPAGTGAIGRSRSHGRDCGPVRLDRRRVGNRAPRHREDGHRGCGGSCARRHDRHVPALPAGAPPRSAPGHAPAPRPRRGGNPPVPVRSRICLAGRGAGRGSRLGPPSGRGPARAARRGWDPPGRGARRRAGPGCVGLVRCAGVTRGAVRGPAGIEIRADGGRQARLRGGRAIVVESGARRGSRGGAPIRTDLAVVGRVGEARGKGPGMDLRV